MHRYFFSLLQTDKSLNTKSMTTYITILLSLIYWSVSFWPFSLSWVYHNITPAWYWHTVGITWAITPFVCLPHLLSYMVFSSWSLSSSVKTFRYISSQYLEEIWCPRHVQTIPFYIQGHEGLFLREISYSLKTIICDKEEE